MTRSLPSFSQLGGWPFSLLLLLLGANLLAQVQSNATPVIRYVRTNGPNTNPATATTWAISTTNLQGAIDASGLDDQVWVATGTYKPGGNANNDISISFAMKSGVSILGEFPAMVSPKSLTTVLSGDIGNGIPSIGNLSNNSYHVIKNSGLIKIAEVEISGVSGQSVQLNLMNLQGKPVHSHRIDQAGSVERVSLPLVADYTLTERL